MKLQITKIIFSSSILECLFLWNNAKFKLWILACKIMIPITNIKNRILYNAALMQDLTCPETLEFMVNFNKNVGYQSPISLSKFCFIPLYFLTSKSAVFLRNY